MLHDIELKQNDVFTVHDRPLRQECAASGELSYSKLAIVKYLAPYSEADTSYFRVPPSCRRQPDDGTT